MSKPPTPNSNYLLDERIMFGWYPGDTDEGLYSNYIDSLLSTGRNVFVNLTTYEEYSYFYNYTSSVIKQVSNPIFIHYSIDDLGVPSDITSYRALIEHLRYLVSQNNKIYIHCRGGHGRSGIVAACLLVNMGYSNEDALSMVAAAHRTREYIPDYPCPQTSEQIQFVKDYSF